MMLSMLPTTTMIINERLLTGHASAERRAPAHVCDETSTLRTSPWSLGFSHSKLPLALAERYRLQLA
jgi:hypothetical protein